MQLQSQQLVSFEAWWHLPITWVEPPNLERGGWSGVGRWSLATADVSTAPSEVFVKRQQNHTTRSWRYPWRGMPTFMVEYQMLKLLAARGIGVPEWIYFGARDFDSRHQVSQRQAILVTRALSGYQPFSSCCDVIFMMQQPALLSAVAVTLQRLHRLGVQHRAMYPKHVFVRSPDTQGSGARSYDIAFIDLEKAKFMFFPWMQGLRDLKQFLSRLPDWTPELQTRFYRAYAANRHPLIRRLGWWWLSRSLTTRQQRPIP